MTAHDETSAPARARGRAVTPPAEPGFFRVCRSWQNVASSALVHGHPSWPAPVPACGQAVAWILLETRGMTSSPIRRKLRMMSS